MITVMGESCQTASAASHAGVAEGGVAITAMALAARRRRLLAIDMRRHIQGQLRCLVWRQRAQGKQLCRQRPCLRELLTSLVEGLVGWCADSRRRAGRRWRNSSTRARFAQRS